MRTLEVVIVDEVADPRADFSQVQEHGRLQAFAPERSPEPLDLAERLWTARGRHDVTNPALLQFARERDLPSGSLFPFTLPRGRSIKPPGSSSSNRFF